MTILALAGLFAFGCQERAGEALSGRLTPVDSALVAEELKEADRAFARATAERGVAGWTEYFAENGTMINDGAIREGRVAIGDLMGPYLESVSLAWEPETSEVSGSGDLGYTVGRYRATPRATPDSTIGTGTYVSIWGRQEDGSWKVLLDTGSPDPEPAE